jgi:hypothetical protein
VGQRATHHLQGSLRHDPYRNSNAAQHGRVLPIRISEEDLPERFNKGAIPDQFDAHAVSNSKQNSALSTVQAQR